jgi:hypothetical protein
MNDWSAEIPACIPEESVARPADIRIVVFTVLAGVLLGFAIGLIVLGVL